MTRLTDGMVKDIIRSLDSANEMLITLTGMDTIELACDAIGITPDMIDLDGIKVGVVPITAGKGTISKFSESVAEIVRRIGMEAFVTQATDVNGLAEAFSANADIVFMADDISFIAINTKAGRFSNNSFATAAGYVSALKGAAKGLKGKDVLVLGAGRVGSIAADLMINMGATVTVYDINRDAAEELSRRIPVKVADDPDLALSQHLLVLNACPGAIDGRFVKEGAIISSPGIPFPFDGLGIKRAETIINDPLDIGVVVMAVQSASFTRLKNL